MTTDAEILAAFKDLSLAIAKESEAAADLAKLRKSTDEAMAAWGKARDLVEARRIKLSSMAAKMPSVAHLAPVLSGKPMVLPEIPALKSDFMQPVPSTDAPKLPSGRPVKNREGVGNAPVAR